MSIYKRGQVYWYKFQWRGQLIRESTKQGNDKVARQMEAAHRTALAKGEVGIREKKPVPSLSEFAETRFEPWIKSTTSVKTQRDFYGVGLRAMKQYRQIANKKLNEITSEVAADFAAHRQSEGMQVSTVNASLRVLRRVLRVAVEWGVIERMPKINLLAGERHRERVLTMEEEGRYLAAASPLLCDVATVLLDTGLRPEECNRLLWEFISWDKGQNGALLVTHGKTKAARRLLPLTPRVRGILEVRWRSLGRPVEGWVWPAPTKSGHVERHLA